MVARRGRPKKPNHAFVPFSECKKLKTARAVLLGRIHQASITPGFQPSRPGRLPTATFLHEYFKKAEGKLSRNTVSAAMKQCVFVDHLQRTKDNKKSPKKVAMDKRRKAIKKAAKQTTVRAGVLINNNPTAAAIKEFLDLDESLSTILRDHYANGGKVFRPQPRPYLNLHIPARLEFCCAVLKLSPADIAKIIFSDECVITANRSSSGTVLAFSREKVGPKITQRRHNVYNFQIFCAVGIGYKSLLILVPKEYKESTRNPGTYTKTVIRSTLNSANYISDALEPIKNKLKGKYFQQDGASMHHSDATYKWLDANGIVRLETKLGCRWPASSPDFNMIELVWANLKKRISNKIGEEGPPGSEAELVRITREAWDEIPQVEIDNTVRHFTSVVSDWYAKNKKN
jgi:hypothetical protein